MFIALSQISEMCSSSLKDEENKTPRCLTDVERCRIDPSRMYSKNIGDTTRLKVTDVHFEVFKSM